VETRYQSSRGLVADLLRCQAIIHKLESAGNDSEDDYAEGEEFEVGKDDVSDVFRIPAKLYGREKEIALLRELYSAATKSQTKSQVPQPSCDLLNVWRLFVVVTS
jgi:hypothetical protein